MTTMTTTAPTVAADLKVTDKANNRTPGYVVKKAATDPNPPKRPRDLVPSDETLLDTRGEAMAVLRCVDCGCLVMVWPQALDFDREDFTVGVVPMCDEDRAIREVWAAIDLQMAQEMAARRERTKVAA